VKKFQEFSPGQIVPGYVSVCLHQGAVGLETLAGKPLIMFLKVKGRIFFLEEPELSF